MTDPPGAPAPPPPSSARPPQFRTRTELMQFRRQESKNAIVEATKSKPLQQRKTSQTTSEQVREALKDVEVKPKLERRNSYQRLWEERRRGRKMEDVVEHEVHVLPRKKEMQWEKINEILTPYHKKLGSNFSPHISARLAPEGRNECTPLDDPDKPIYSSFSVDKVYHPEKTKSLRLFFQKEKRKGYHRDEGVGERKSDKTDPQRVEITEPSVSEGAEAPSSSQVTHLPELRLSPRRSQYPVELFSSRRSSFSPKKSPRGVRTGGQKSEFGVSMRDILL